MKYMHISITINSKVYVYVYNSTVHHCPSLKGWASEQATVSHNLKHSVKTLIRTAVYHCPSLERTSYSAYGDGSPMQGSLTAAITSRHVGMPLEEKFYAAFVARHRAIHERCASIFFYRIHSFYKRQIL